MEPQSTPNTQMGDCRDRLDALSRQVIGCALTVMRTPGDRVLRESLFEKVYKNALVHALRKAGVTVAQQHRMVVRYDDVVVGDDTGNLLVGNIVL
ncbi:MAG TPA: GxxExxY protein [Rhodopila sp.]|uniref:GxxExxY protein n=1 Tax=Rhodopila sp. TaxID=2480087 RepID=UPI002C7A9B0C|nr:GxxExxY protein [Rhodopila sp.]HVY16135.1 GxxExxY protein [Rhodopila sp.]